MKKNQKRQTIKSTKPITIEQSSFRDPSGSVYQDKECVYRTVMPTALEDYQYVRKSGLIAKLIEKKNLVAERQIANTLDLSAALVLEHPRLPFISYPYEWCFSALKAAALLQLDIHLEALQYEVTLSDASSYNIQFIGSRPIFIDHLSFIKYKPYDIWWGHRQFCQHYLNPLLLQSACSIDFQFWLRSHLDGIDTLDLARILPWRKKYFSYNIFMHVVLQAKLQTKALSKKNMTPKKVNLPKKAFENILQSLRNFIAKLELSDKIQTAWQDYTKERHYSGKALKQKQIFVQEFAAHYKPDLLWDLGCNTGHFSLSAIDAGANYVIGFDCDAKVLDMAFNHAAQSPQKFLPLYLNLANPSPNQGFAGNERKNLLGRQRPDAIFALALIHHLVIIENIPLQMALDYLISLAPCGLIEFIPKDDPKVQTLLSTRKDIFRDYNETNFMNIIKQKATIKKIVRLSDLKRVLVWYEV